MDKLIITITCDPTMSYPHNPYNPTPKGLEAVADEYARSVRAGASICHLHGPYTVDAKIRDDNTKLSDLNLDGWTRLRELIYEKCDPIKPIIQYGIANGRFPQRVAQLRKDKPDMMSICFNPHDECFDYNPGAEPVELYGIHSRDELAEYCRVTKETGTKPEVESFHYGGVWNAQRMVQMGLLAEPVWTTFFLGWKGGCWTPPTPQAMVYMNDHKPANFNYSTSVMDPELGWPILTTATILGGHVRVGMEDNPFVSSGVWAKSNAELVEKMVRIANDVGRQVATPDEARKITGLTK
jgi:3-keto-5-aminohexanoate cleavage enzyme